MKKQNKKRSWEKTPGDVDQYDGEILGRKHVLTGHHKLYVTAYKKNGERFIKIDRAGPIPAGQKWYFKNVRISSSSQWLGIKKAIEDLVKVVGWNVSSNEAEQIIHELKESSDNKSKLDKSLKRNKRLKHLYDNLQQQISQTLDYSRIAKLPQFKESLIQFEKLVSEKKNEGTYQKYLARPENMWILGSEYISINRHKQAGTEGWPDFVPQRFDGFHDVIEFKRPNHKLFVKVGAHLRMSKDLKDGLSQVIDYLELYDRKPSGDDDIVSISDKYRPNGFLIIGLLSDYAKNERKEIEYCLKRHNSFLHRITILSYDLLIDRAKSLLAHWESVPLDANS